MEKKLEFDELMTIYDHIGNEERHFNMLELEYRKLASQWLLVSLGAVGYVLSRAANIPIDTWALVIGICIVASVGIFVLWMLDLKVYHRLLNAAYEEGVKLENNYPDSLPRIRNNMKKVIKGGSISKKVLFYYFFSILLLLSVANIAIWMMEKSPTGLCVLMNFGSALLALLIFKVMSQKDVAKERIRNSQAY